MGAALCSAYGVWAGSSCWRSGYSGCTICGVGASGTDAVLSGVSSSAIVVAPNDFNQEGPKKDSSSSSDFSSFTDCSQEGSESISGAAGLAITAGLNESGWDGNVWGSDDLPFDWSSCAGDALTNGKLPSDSDSSVKAAESPLFAGLSVCASILSQLGGGVRLSVAGGNGFSSIGTPQGSNLTLGELIFSCCLSIGEDTEADMSKDG